MIKTMDTRENYALSVLLRAIPEELQPQQEDNVVRAVHDGDSWTFRPVWVGEGLPADARRARNEVAHRIDEDSDTVPVVVARRISSGAREMLEAEQLSWADASGRARLVVPGRLYVTRLAPIPVDTRRAFQWSTAAEAIAETLLTWRFFRGEDGSSIDRVHEVAEASGVSFAHTARVLRQFDEQRYTVKTGAERGSSAGRAFQDPGRMLSDWAGHYVSGAGPGRAVEFHVPWRDTDRSLRAMNDALADVGWAVTGAVAADMVAPYLTSVADLEFYVPVADVVTAQRRLVQNPDVVEVESGGRVRMFAAEPHVFRMADAIGAVQGVKLVSPVRVYADLLRRGGRWAEAAEHLRETTIGF